MNAAGLEVRAAEIRSGEDLREAAQGADLRIVQLVPGRFRGALMHANIDGLAFSTGVFAPDIRARGVMHPNACTIGMLLDTTGEVSQWDYDVSPGDAVVFPEHVEQEGHFTGSSAYATISMTAEELATFARGEPELDGPDFWRKLGRYRSSPVVARRARESLAAGISLLRDSQLLLRMADCDLLRRSIIESFLSGIIHERPAWRDRRAYPGAKLVREVEDYADGQQGRAIHISEICAVLGVSRRSLHRAFADALGIGPSAYLRRRRLAAVRSSLRTPDTASGGVTQAALEQGFYELGQFARGYQKMFGEMPSETMRKARGQAR
jgi:AraC family ethanolamine operon transcriptional activator